MSQDQSYYVDIHLHSTLKSFNSGYPEPPRNIWEDLTHNVGKTNPARFIHKNSAEIAKYSQSNFYELARGRVRVANVSLYPIEKGFLELRNLSKAVTNKIARDEMLEVITGYGMSSIRYLRKHLDYFEELQDEYAYIRDQQGTSPDKKWSFRIANNYRDLQAILGKGPDTLAVILHVEGAHVFFNEKMLSGKLSKSEVKKELMANILKVKEWETPPFSVNLCHHFYNGLCGHSKSFSGFLGVGLLNQVKGMESGLTGLGIKALKELLSSNNGKRILIDTKHMSLAGRIEFYNWIRSYNYLSKSDKIPIICSHTGMNGFKTMTGSLVQPDTNKKLNNQVLNRWSINISDEEINIIHETGGLIGIMLDKYKLGGNKFFNAIKNITDREKLRDAYSRAFMDNVLQVVHAVGKPSAWDLIAIGSDYDGAIPHVDFYDKASTMPDLHADLVRFLEKTKYGKNLWYGYKPADLVDKIMRKNAMDFYERFFV